jgi:hypothetical protein
MKKAGLLILFTISCTLAFAQAHNYRSCCRYFKAIKGSAMAECVCLACDKDKKDEVKAAEEETKQLIEKAKAEQAVKDAADKKVREEAEKKKIADQKQKENNNIVIGDPNQKKEPIPKPVNEKASYTDNTVMVPFHDSEGKSMFGVDQYGFMDTARKLLFFAGSYPNSTSTFYGYGTNSYHHSVPFNLGLLKIGYRSLDIVYPSGKREFNDNSVRIIWHLRDNFFLVEKENSHYLYNIKTKKFTLLPEPSPSDTYYSYTPIFDDLSYDVPEHIKRTNQDFLRYIPNNKLLKEKSLNAFPGKVTEELLKNNSFCLLISYSNQAAFDTHPNATWNPQIVYVSKTGELIWK